MARRRPPSVSRPPTRAGVRSRPHRGPRPRLSEARSPIIAVPLVAQLVYALGQPRGMTPDHPSWVAHYHSQGMHHIRLLKVWFGPCAIRDLPGWAEGVAAWTRIPTMTTAQVGLGSVAANRQISGPC